MNKFERYCISLPQGQKQRLIGLLKESINQYASGKTFEMLHMAIVRIVGNEVISGSRLREVVIGRAILAYTCAIEGWSETAIGELLQRDHSTVNIMKKKMREWLKAPHIFKKENEMYVKYLRELKNEADTRTI